MLLNNLAMDIQAEKLQLIEWLARLQDAEIVQRLLKIKKDNEAASYEASLKPMTKEELTDRKHTKATYKLGEFAARAEEANHAIANGEHIAIEDALNGLGS